MDSRGRKRATRELPGQTTIAHGLLTLALAPAFVRSVLSVKGIKDTLKLRSEPEIRYLTRCQPVQSCAVAFVFSYRPTVCELPTELHLKSKMVTGL